jgi:flagellar FliL protein
MAKLIPIIGAAVAALVIGAGAAWFLKPAPPAQAPLEAQQEETFQGFLFPVKDKVINLADPGAKRYLKITVALQVPESPAAAAKRKAPPTPEDEKAFQEEFNQKFNAQVNDVLISVLSAKKTDDISTTEGKERLREELKGRINSFLPRDQKVNKIFLTDFVIQ